MNTGRCCCTIILNLGSNGEKMMAYQDNEEKRSGRIGVRDLENWIEEAERILAQMDKYQRTGDRPKNGDCTDKGQASPAHNATPHVMEARI
jgi:hypothetical protein